MKKLLFVLLALLPIATFAQRYEGERNKKGEPDGQGTMYFDAVYDGIAYTERLEGTFKKGVPVNGKSFRYYKNTGRPSMKFEGTFKLKKKGVLRNLADLVAVGHIVFYYYEENKYFNERGYQIDWGEYDQKFINGYSLFCKGRRLYRREGNIIMTKNNLAMTPEAQKYYEEVYSKHGSAWILDRMPTYDRKLVNTPVGKQDQFIKLDNIYWTGNIVDGFIDGTGEGFAAVKVEKGDVEYTINGEFKRGIAVDVKINRKYEFHRTFDHRSDYSSLIFSMGDLQNNERPFTIESLTHEDQLFDKSYSGFVDADFKFKEDYFANEKKRFEDSKNFGKAVGTVVAAAVVGAVAASSGSSGSGSITKALSSSNSSSASSKSENSSSSSSVDIENIKMPEYNWTSEWKKDVSGVDKVMGTEKVAWSHRDIRFTDKEAGKTWIGRDADQKRYSISTGAEYTNLNDAIKAAYVYMKYGKKRQTGKR